MPHVIKARVKEWKRKRALTLRCSALVLRLRGTRWTASGRVSITGRLFECYFAPTLEYESTLYNPNINIHNLHTPLCTFLFADKENSFNSQEIL